MVALDKVPTGSRWAGVHLPCLLVSQSYRKLGSLLLHLHLHNDPNPPTQHNKRREREQQSISYSFIHSLHQPSLPRLTLLPPMQTRHIPSHWSFLIAYLLEVSPRILCLNLLSSKEFEYCEVTLSKRYPVTSITQGGKARMVNMAKDVMRQHYIGKVRGVRRLLHTPLILHYVEIPNYIRTLFLRSFPYIHTSISNAASVCQS